MGKFLTNLKISPNKDNKNDWNGRDWIIDEELVYETNDNYTIYVPKGFVTDGASVPKILWNLFPPFDSYIEAAIVHDFLYRTTNYLITRKKADRIFYDAMCDTKVKIITKFIVWLGVRTGGKNSFKKRLNFKDNN